MRQELATTVKATDPDGHFEAVGDPVSGAQLVKIIGSVSLKPEAMSTSQANYVAITDGTGYSKGDPITATMWWDTSTPANPAFLAAAFYNWETNLEITPSMAHLQQTGGDAMTATEYEATIGKVGIDQTAGQNVIAVSARICISHQPITVPITTGVTLASICSGGGIPVGAVTCDIQALDGVVRYRLDGSTVTPTSGMRLNVDEKVPIDSALASVRLVAQSSAVACSAAFFDRV